MLSMYGLANGNGLKARRLYVEQCPDSSDPDRDIFENIHERLHATETFKPTGELGRLMTVRMVQLKEFVLNIKEHNRGRSSQKL